jgi:6-hydroxynicotinate 3-monooxygenase
LRKAFEGFDRQVETVLASCPDVHKWAIVDRCSLAHWSDRNVTLLGDACHPMTPYMAQGAAMAIEDAAVLSRCLEGVERDQVTDAFRRFEATRKERTELVQQTSRANKWLSGKTNADWVYGYDAWNVPLAA